MSLRDAIQQALRVDPQTVTASIRKDQSTLAVVRSQLERLSLRADVSLGEQWQAANILSTSDRSGGVQTGGIGTLNASATLQVPLFTGFRISSEVARAKHLREAAKASADLTARTIALDVLRSYWAIRRLEMQRAVALDALKRYEEAVVVVQARVRAGLALPTDANRIETRRLHEMARVASLEGASREGYAQLAVALSLEGSRLELTEQAEPLPVPPKSPDQVDQLLAQARTARPELRAARSQTLAGLEGIRLARSPYFPQLTALMMLQYGNSTFSPTYNMNLTFNDSANPFSSLSGSFVVGATLSWNLFDTWNTKLAVRDARYELALKEEEERRLGKLIRSDVVSAHARLLRLYQTREPMLKQRDLARDTLAIIEGRYQNGNGLILDYLDAQLELLNAEIELADSTAAIAQTWGELWAATGRIPGVR